MPTTNATLINPHQPLPLSRLSTYISQNIPSISLPLQSIHQFTRGQSNPTYLLTTTSNQRYVLRKKPPGGSILSKTAHDVEREYRIMSALEEGKTGVPVPKMYGLCKDETVLGEVFYIMGFVDGRVFDDWCFAVIQDGRLRRKMWRSAMHTLARIHRVPLSSLPKDLISPRRRIQTQHPNQKEQEDFYTRQLRTLSRISANQSQTINPLTNQRTPAIPHFETTLSLLSQHLHRLPAQTRTRTSLIHNDYKINNLIYHPAPTNPGIIAVLDWELATLGNPLADLANLLVPFISPPGQEAEVDGHGGKDGWGLPTREECLDWYAERAGWRPSRGEIMFADAFAALRNSVIVQGIVARRALGQAASVSGGGGAVGGMSGSGEEMGQMDFPMLIGEYGEFAWKLVRGLERLGEDDGEGEAEAEAEGEEGVKQRNRRLEKL